MRKRLALYGLTSLAALLGYWGWNAYQERLYYSKFTPEQIEQLKINYEVTLDIIAKLEAILKSEGKNLRREKKQSEQRFPRHVWHKGRLVFQELNYLKEKRGVPHAEPPQFLNRPITTKDAFALLQTIDKETDEIQRSYGVESPPPEHNMPGIILPRDVYDNLAYISYLISSLHTMLVQPSHVYQVAEALVWEARRISGIQSLSPTISTQSSTGKSPRDVYDRAFELLEVLSVWDQHNGYDIPGGIFIVDRDRGHIIPGDVLNLLISILADMDAMRLEMGDTEPVAQFPFKEGMTPSNVFDKVTETLKIVREVNALSS